MKIHGLVVRADRKHITIETDEEINFAVLQRARQRNGRVYGVFEVDERDTITDLQRRHYYALMRDFSYYTGYPMDAADAMMRVSFMLRYGLEEYPTLRRNGMTMSVARKLITYVIQFFLAHEIPFCRQDFYLTANQEVMNYSLTMKRLCWICGKEHSDIHHVEPVGMGRNRKKIDHSRHTYMCLCREHHREIHQSGLEAFCSKYHVEPIRLHSRDLNRLGLEVKEG